MTTSVAVAKTTITRHKRVTRADRPAPEAARKALVVFLARVRAKMEAEIHSLTTKREPLQKSIAELEATLKAKPDPQGLEAKVKEVDELDAKIDVAFAAAIKTKDKTERAKLQKEVLELQQRRRKLWPEIIETQANRVARAELTAKIGYAKSLLDALPKDLGVREELVRQARDATAPGDKKAILLDAMTAAKAGAISKLVLGKMSPQDIWDFLLVNDLVDKLSDGYLKMKNALDALAEAVFASDAALQAGKRLVRVERARLAQLQERADFDEENLRIPDFLKEGILEISEELYEFFDAIASFGVDVLSVWKNNPVSMTRPAIRLVALESRLRKLEPKASLADALLAAAQKYWKSGKITEDVARGIITTLLLEVLPGPVKAVIGFVMLAGCIGGNINRIEEILDLPRDENDTVLDDDDETTRQKKDERYLRRQLAAFEQYFEKDLMPLLVELGAGALTAKSTRLLHKGPVAERMQRIVRTAKGEAKTARSNAEAIEARAEKLWAEFERTGNRETKARADRLMALAEQAHARAEALDARANGFAESAERAPAVEKVFEHAKRKLFDAYQSGNPERIALAERAFRSAADSLNALRRELGLPETTVGRPHAPKNLKVRTPQDVQNEPGVVAVGKDGKVLPGQESFEIAREAAGLAGEDLARIEVKPLEPAELPYARADATGTRVEVGIPKAGDGKLRLSDLTHELTEARLRFGAGEDPVKLARLEHAQRAAERYKKALETQTEVDAARIEYQNAPTELECRVAEARAEAARFLAEADRAATEPLVEQALQDGLAAEARAAALQARMGPARAILDATSYEQFQVALKQAQSAGFAPHEIAALRAARVRFGTPVDWTGAQVAEALGGKLLEPKAYDGEKFASYMFVIEKTIDGKNKYFLYKKGCAMEEADPSLFPNKESRKRMVMGYLTRARLSKDAGVAYLGKFGITLKKNAELTAFNKAKQVVYEVLIDGKKIGMQISYDIGEGGGSGSGLPHEGAVWKDGTEGFKDSKTRIPVDENLQPVKGYEDRFKEGRHGLIKERIFGKKSSWRFSLEPPFLTVDLGDYLIKGNIARSGERIYHIVERSRTYEQTKVRSVAGERWFATEGDALAAGWRASRS